MVDYTAHRMVPKGYQEVARDDATGAIVFAGGSPGRLAAMAFSGKRGKADWHYSFKTPEALAAKALEHLKIWRDNAERMNKRRNERNAEGRGVDLGDVVCASWGYDQTNVDFYQVTALIGSKMVEVRKIGGKSEVTGWDRGQCKPTPGHFIGEPLRRLAKGGYVKIDDVRHAHKVDANSSHYWSSYA